MMMVSLEVNYDDGGGGDEYDAYDDDENNSNDDDIAMIAARSSGMHRLCCYHNVDSKYCLMYYMVVWLTELRTRMVS